MRIYRKDEGWRFGRLLRQLRRGSRKGRLVVELPKADGTTKRVVVPSEKVVCVCCGLSLAGVDVREVAGRLHMRREP